MRKEGYTSPVETILATPEFRRSFGAYLIARASGGRAYLSKELFQEDSVIGTIVRFSQRRGKLRLEELKEAEAYLS